MQVHANVVFRVDSSIDIGTGHVMRCLTLADALRAQGAKCRFVCREHAGHLQDLIRHRRYTVHLLPPAPDLKVSAINRTVGGQEPVHAPWLGVDWATDAQETRAVLGDQPVDWLVVDHYALDFLWEQHLRPACRRLMVIDDLADRSHDCDLLLDQNLGRSADQYAHLLSSTRCKVLTGPQYALLRPEFAAMRPISLARRRIPELRHILISMGGVDKNNATGKVLDALRSCPLPENCRITVVMGEHAPWLASIRDMAGTMPWPVEVQVNVTEMAALMAASDLAIGAAGTTAWERCCLGLPTLVLVLANNQRQGAQALQQAGAVDLCDASGDFGVQIRSKLSHLSQLSVLTKMSDACSLITDGRGAVKIAEAMSHEEL